MNCWSLFGTILGQVWDNVHNLFDKKHETHLKYICFRFVLPRGSFGVPSKGWGGGRGTILGQLYEYFIYVIDLYLLIYLFIYI